MSKNARMYGEHQSETMEIDGVVMRICVFCGKQKPLVDFPRNGLTPEGAPAYRYDCKVCYNIRRTENNNKKKHSDFIGGQKRRGEVAPDIHSSRVEGSFDILRRRVCILWRHYTKRCALDKGPPAGDERWRYYVAR